MGKNRGPETDPGKYNPPTFDKGTKVIQQKNDNVFNKWCWNDRTFACQKN